MKLLVLTGLMWMSASVAAAGLDNLKQDFLRTTGLQERDTELVSGPAYDENHPGRMTCMQGDLHLEPEADGNSVALILGARALVPGIGAPASQLLEQRCHVSGRTTYESRRAVSVSTEECPNRRTSYETVVESTADGFKYTSTVTGGKKGAQTITCVYRYEGR